MKKQDIILALVAGGGVGWLIFRTIRDSGLVSVYGVSADLLGWFGFLLFPVLSLFCLWLSYIVGKRFLFVFQAAKFVLVGILATLLDLIIFKSLGWISGLSSDWSRSVFKGVSFFGATFGKYWGNKLLAFEHSEMGSVQKEMTQFFVVTLIGMGINVGIFSLIVNTLGPQFGINMQVWETFGVILAALAGAGWNFLGYKVIVFKK
jgi:putative flippase GtrA